MTFEPKHLKRWTMPECYVGEVWPAYYSSGVGQSRDSDALERSNFQCMLEALGGETETVIVVRESHWLVGWVEWIAIHQDDEVAVQKADEIKGALKDYPVINEEHWSNLEFEEAANYWDAMSPRQRVQMAIEERNRHRWLAKEPVWMIGRMDYGDLCNHGSTITEALCESLRS